MRRISAALCVLAAAFAVSAAPAASAAEARSDVVMGSCSWC